MQCDVTTTTTAIKNKLTNMSFRNAVSASLLPIAKKIKINETAKYSPMTIQKNAQT